MILNVFSELGWEEETSLLEQLLLQIIRNSSLLCVAVCMRMGGEVCKFLGPGLASVDPFAEDPETQGKQFYRRGVSLR